MEGERAAFKALVRLSRHLPASYTVGYAAADSKVALAHTREVGSNVVSYRPYSKVMRDVKVNSAATTHGKVGLTASKGRGWRPVR